jgi:hypothetical protein
LANTKPLRSRPKKKRDRKQLAELNNLLADPSIAGELRARLEAERDILAPIIGSLPEVGSSSVSTSEETRVPSNPVAAFKQAVYVPDRAAAERAIATLAEHDKARFIEKARNASPAEKALVLLKELPSHPLVKLATESAAYCVAEDKSNPKPSLEVETGYRLKHWLSGNRRNYNGADIRGSFVTVEAAVKDALRLVAEKDAEQPGWFVRLTESRYY